MYTLEIERAQLTVVSNCNVDSQVISNNI
jgi:hypothetical protein